MKKLLLFAVSAVMSFGVLAQTATVTILLHGNANRAISIDGVNYPLSTYTGNNQTSGMAYNSTVLNNVSEGEHTIIVTNVNNSRRNDSRKFYVRTEYDLMITVNGNGAMEFKETSENRRGRNDRFNRNEVKTAMSNTDYNVLYNQVRSISQMTSRMASLNTIFANRTNYFSSTQVKQLIALSVGETNRLALAKTAYNNVVDPTNYRTIYSLLRYQSSRNDLANYISSASNQTGGTYDNNLRQPMNEANFNIIYNDARNRWQVGDKVAALNNAFTSSTNFFTSYQVNQLLSLVTDENERLQLAKVAYRTVTDPNNFTAVVINRFSTVDMRNQLANYVRTFDPNNPGNGYTYGGSTGSSSNVAMNNSDFNVLLQNIQKQWFPGAKKTAALEAFTNVNNYFSADQVRQIVMVETDEANRLDLAKASYRSITNPEYFYQVIDLFTNASYKDDLTRYVNNYKTTNAGGYNTNYNKTPMGSTNFDVLYEDTRKQWFPGAKKTAILTAFANANNYFTVDQVVRLITLDNDEADRLDMAKAALRSITDPASINTLYNVFTNSIYRDQLVAYVRDYRFN